MAAADPEEDVGRLITPVEARVVAYADRVFNESFMRKLEEGKLTSKVVNLTISFDAAGGAKFQFQDSCGKPLTQFEEIESDVVFCNDGANQVVLWSRRTRIYSSRVLEAGVVDVPIVSIVIATVSVTDMIFGDDDDGADRAFQVLMLKNLQSVAQNWPKFIEFIERRHGTGRLSPTPIFLII